MKTVKVMSLITGALGTVHNDVEKQLEETEMFCSASTIGLTLKTCKITRRVLNT